MDAQDCNDETNKILFGDTLLKHLKKVKVTESSSNGPVTYSN